MFNTLFYDPLYNALVALINIIPGQNVGLAIVLLTILVKIALLPLSHKSTKSQAKMKEIEPHVQKVRDKHKDNKQLQAQEIMQMYQKHGVNPFSGCFLILLQLPIILALYFVFMRGLPVINPESLYGFVALPAAISMSFIGFDLAGKSLILAAAAAIAQYFQMKIAMPDTPKPKPKKPGEKIEFKDELTRNMTSQMRYILPGIIFFVAYTISAAVALYWFVSALFSVGQEWWVRRDSKPLKVEDTNEGGNK